MDEQHVETHAEPQQVVEAPGLAEDVVTEDVAPGGDGADEGPVIGRPGAVEDVLPLPSGEIGVGPGPDPVEEVDGEEQPRGGQATGDGLGHRGLAGARGSVEEDEPAGRHGPDRSEAAPGTSRICSGSDVG